MNICVIGAGAVGLVHSACMADIGHQVICVEEQEQKVHQINQGVMPIYEEGLEEMIKRNREKGRLSFTRDLKQGVQGSTVIFVCVGTPMDKDGAPDLSQVLKVSMSIAKHMDEYKVIVMKSTVPVGTTSMVEDIICLNRKEKVDFDVVSNPEFLREGTGIWDTFHGDRIVMGGNSVKAVEMVKSIYEPLQIPIMSTTPQSSEMIKYASNTFLAVKISYINEIANICEKVGADVREVAKGMGMDQRIGERFLQAGVGFGGACFPKDVNAIIKIAEEYNYDFRIAKETLQVNELQKRRAVDTLESYLDALQGKTVTILGLAFKPNTNDMRNASSLDIIHELLARKVRVKAYDPIVKEYAEGLPKEVILCQDPYEAARDTHGIILVTHWKEFKELDLQKLHSVVKIPIFIDGRNCMNPHEMMMNHFFYKGIGVSTAGYSPKDIKLKLSV